jgi:hypothetical protein
MAAEEELVTARMVRQGKTANMDRVPRRWQREVGFLRVAAKVPVARAGYSGQSREEAMRSR